MPCASRTKNLPKTHIMPNPVIIAVAPNGARKTKADHPALPISPEELGLTAKACQEAGAAMIHLHVRDAGEQHSLDPDHYRAAIKKVRAEVGDEMIIQVTTESIGKYTPIEQMDCVKQLKPEAVSLAISELIPTQEQDLEAARFLEWLHRSKIAPQFILYSPADIEHFNTLVRRGVIHSDNPSVLLVLGKYSENQQSDPKELPPLIEHLQPQTYWSVCAFGISERECMATAIDLGGHCRIGFENNILNENGDLASDNASQVEISAARAKADKRGLASASEARLLMGVRC